MLSRTLLAASVLLPLLVGCESPEPVSPPHETAAFAPADTENKEVITVNATFSPVCDGGDVLAAELDGWVQVMGGEGNNLQLDIFHLVFTFTNADGKIFVFPDVGPDRVYVKNGSLFLAITGRSSGGQFIGHVVIDLATNQAVLIAGKELGTLLEEACAALT